MLLAPEYSTPVAYVGTVVSWIGFGGLQLTISAYDNVSVLLN